MDHKEANEELKKRRQDRERADAFRAMVKTEGWVLYQELLNTHIGTRTTNIFEPTPANGQLEAEHNKGTVYGLIFARDLPSVIIAASDNERASEPTQEDDEQ